MNHPFLNTSKLTDDELQERLNKAYDLYFHYQGAQNEAMVDQLKLILDALMLENEERMDDQKRKEQIEKDGPEDKPLDIGE